ncbi:amidase family protein [Streptomyces sp. Ncost-T10-10d]|uniref:amidase family protein n=1 Tax=Streptomyces sp. Ncost-T10-10d TaxID=1839774 RepID=UPI00081F2001|nr:amidase family protein [Streptomyces sp. Ncost-T10-10d]SCF59426.1 Amidase [Streptomyces sp. Ncost-T10-10d]
MRGPDAVATAAAVRSGETDARTVTAEAIARVERLDPALGAVVGTRFAQAHAEVAPGLPDGPLHGVPLLVKDLGTDVAGLPATGGSRLFADGTARHDSDPFGGCCVGLCSRRGGVQEGGGSPPVIARRCVRKVSKWSA